MSKQAAEHHHQAAEHHEHAARHHREAAAHHEADNHETAAHHAHTAQGHLHHADGAVDDLLPGGDHGLCLLPAEHGLSDLRRVDCADLLHFEIMIAAAECTDLVQLRRRSSVESPSARSCCRTS